MPLTEALQNRSTICELCASETDLAPWEVPPVEDPSADRAVLLCGTCRSWVEGGEVDPAHAFCLQGAAWSEVPAVQVVAWRLLAGLSDSWAIDLRDQIYLEEATLEWARAGLLEEDDKVIVVDSNGTELQEGDSVTLIKDLDVKGANFTAKRGTMVKNIHLGDDPTHVLGRVNKQSIYLKTEFLKKA